jgi:putative flippase GtrA
VPSFRPPSDELRTFGRFLVVGLLNTAFGYLTFALMVHWLTRPLALLCSHALGVAFNFHSTSIGVFHQYRYRLLLRFVLAYGAVYGFNLALLESLCQLGGAPDLLAQGIAVPFAAVFSFVVLRRFVFVRRPVVTAHV